MEAIFSQDYWLLWMAGLGLALFLPVRRLIWVLYMRRALGRAEIEEAEARRLKRRATVTAALLCLVFSFLYTSFIFRAAP